MSEHAAATPIAIALAASTVWKAVAGLDLEPVHVGKPWRQTDDERAYAYLLAQYGGLLRRVQEATDAEY